MTRINVGIDPEELCDAHLLAEYRELPRLFAFYPKGKAPEHFKFGKGHVLWCAQFPGMLWDRYTALVLEMQNRGFQVNYPTAPPEFQNGKRPDEEEIKRAIPIVRERIRSRLGTMKKKPRWTPKKSLGSVQG